MTDWTAPRTWANDDLVDADDLNTHVRDNMLHLKEKQDALGAVARVTTSSRQLSSVQTLDITSAVETIDTIGLEIDSGTNITIPAGLYAVTFRAFMQGSGGSTAVGYVSVYSVTNSAALINGATTQVNVVSQKTDTIATFWNFAEPHVVKFQGTLTSAPHAVNASGQIALTRLGDSV
jgi:hypothetical protein